MRVMTEHVAINGADTSVAQTLILDRAKNESSRERENARNRKKVTFRRCPLQRVMSHIRCKGYEPRWPIIIIHLVFVPVDLVSSSMGARMEACRSMWCRIAFKLTCTGSLPKR